MRREEEEGRERGGRGRRVVYLSRRRQREQMK